MYSVFLQHIQTSAGKLIIRQHSQDQNCKVIYKELVKKYSKSPEAQANAQEI